MPKGTVTRITRNPNNKLGCIVSLDNNDTLWLQTTYVKSVLESNFIDDARPTALIGSEVEYKVSKVKKDDFVLDKNGLVAVGTTIQYGKDQNVTHSIRFDSVEGHVTAFDKAKMQADAFAKASVKAASIFSLAKPKQIEQVANEPETSAEESKVEDKVEADDTF